MLNLKKLKLWHWLAIGLIIFNIFVIYYSSIKPDGLVHIYFLNVGQGDSILIKTANNQYILIDGGPNNSAIKLVDRVLPVGTRKLDLVILTHPHADHAVGLIEIANRYQIGEFVFNGLPYTTETYNTLLNLIEARNIDINIVDESDKYEFGESTLDIIHPFNDGVDINVNPNDTSIVSIFDYLDFELLLTGDISIDVEKQLIQNGSIFDIDVLKVGHHGSRTSTSRNFLNILKPEASVIGVGKNQFGHPHSETLNRITNISSQVFRTDLNGTVEIITDGHTYQILTE